MRKAVSRKKESYVKNCPGHKNSKGEAAPWCIISHDSGKILSSHKTEEEAKEHLKDMHVHGGSIMNFKEAKSLDELLEKSEKKEKKKTKEEEIPLAIFEDTPTAIDEQTEKCEREHEVIDEHRDVLKG